MAFDIGNVDLQMEVRRRRSSQQSQLLQQKISLLLKLK